MKIKPKTLNDILEAREKFIPISNISYAFSKLNKDYPLDTIDEQTGQELLKEYERLYKKFLNLLKTLNKY